MKNPSTNRGRKKDGPKSKKNEAWSAQGPKTSPRPIRDLSIPRAGAPGPETRGPQDSRSDIFDPWALQASIFLDFGPSFFRPRFFDGFFIDFGWILAPFWHHFLIRRTPPGWRACQTEQSQLVLAVFSLPPSPAPLKIESKSWQNP